MRESSRCFSQRDCFTRRERIARGNYENFNVFEQWRIAGFHRRTCGRKDISYSILPFVDLEHFLAGGWSNPLGGQRGRNTLWCRVRILNRPRFSLRRNLDIVELLIRKKSVEYQIVIEYRIDDLTNYKRTIYKTNINLINSTRFLI